MKAIKTIPLTVNKAEVGEAIFLLKSIDVDGETMQFIIEQLGMDEQMHKQLNVKFNNNLKQ